MVINKSANPFFKVGTGSFEVAVAPSFDVKKDVAVIHNTAGK